MNVKSVERPPDGVVVRRGGSGVVTSPWYQMTVAKSFGVAEQCDAHSLAWMPCPSTESPKEEVRVAFECEIVMSDYYLAVDSVRVGDVPTPAGVRGYCVLKGGGFLTSSGAVRESLVFGSASCFRGEGNRIPSESKRKYPLDFKRKQRKSKTRATKVRRLVTLNSVYHSNQLLQLSLFHTLNSLLFFPSGKIDRPRIASEQSERVNINVALFSYRSAFGDGPRLNHVQVTWTTPELAPSSPNYHTTSTGRLMSSRQI
ncbi:hypothetical protein TNCV_4165061 [Trichonephila clavipes]|nr:hypothetical protein TNCV_4165061 [Trichonephila clavipes]